MIDRRLPRREGNRVYPAIVIFSTVMLILHEGARCLVDIRLLQQESVLMKLMGMKRLPGAHTLGNWLRALGRARSPWVHWLKSTDGYSRPNCTIAGG